MKKQLLLFALMLLPLVASAHDIEVNNTDGVTIYYNYINGGTELEVTYKGDVWTSSSEKYQDNVVIPEEVSYMNNILKVTRIGLSAFADSRELTSVKIPNSVTNIDKYAFEQCRSLTSITIPNSVTNIGHGAFQGCSGLTSVTIPSIVTSIGNSAFASCFGLTSVTIGNSVTNIGAKAFSQCSRLTSVTIPNSVMSIGSDAFYGCSGLISVTIGNSVTSIGAGAFYQCSGLASITLPNSVTSIEEHAFSGCSDLYSVTFGSGLTSVGNNAFSDCSSIKKVIVSDIAAWCGISFANEYANPLYYSQRLYKDKSTEIQNLVIPNGVVNIRDYTFYGCSGLTSVTIPNSVTSIGGLAFAECSGLSTITLNCKGVGAWFNNLASIKEVVIGKDVTSIAQQAFSGCSNLQSVYSKVEDVFTISKNTFADKTYSDAKLYVPIGKKVDYEDTPWWLNFTNIVEYDYGTDTSDDLPTCQTPTISYLNGVLTFNSDTEGAVCQYSITDEDIKSGSGNEVQLSATYTINVFASKEGYENSDTATATLCWIDVEPKTEDVTTAVAEVPAFAVLIKNEGGALTVQGIDDGTQVSIYDVNGTQVGTAVVQNGQATVSTTLQSGSIAIVKIGQKSVKVQLR